MLQDPMLARVAQLLSQKAGGRPVGPETAIVADTGLDSVSVMDFVLELEDEFDVILPLERIAEVRTVEELVRALRELTGERQ